MLCAGFDFVHLIIAKHPPPVHHACTTGSPQKLMDESIFGNGVFISRNDERDGIHKLF